MDNVTAAGVQLARRCLAHPLDHDDAELLAATTVCLLADIRAQLIIVNESAADVSSAARRLSGGGLLGMLRS